MSTTKATSEKLSGSSGRQAGALAVPHQAQSGGVDRLVARQKVQGNPDVGDQFLVPTFILVARRAAYPSVVHPKDDQAGASQVIREDEEGPMATKSLIPVIGA